MDTDELLMMANTTTAKLSQVWAMIGLTDGEKDTEMRALTSSLQGICQSTLKTEEEETQRMDKEVRECRTEIMTVRRQLEKPGSDGDSPVSSASAASAPTAPLLDTLASLTLVLEELRAEKAARVAEFEAKLADLHGSWEALGSSTDASAAHLYDASLEELGDDITARRLARVVDLGAKAEAEIEKRRAIVAEQGEAVAALLGTLGEAPAADSASEAGTREALVAAGEYASMGVHHETLGWLCEREEALLATKRERTHLMGQLAQDITDLWNELRVPDCERKEFFEARNKMPGLSEATIAACRDELARMQQKKQESLCELVTDARARLHELWNATYVSQARRAEFKPAFVDEYSEESLEAHRKEIFRMEKRLGRLEPITKLIRQRARIRAGREQYEMDRKNTSYYGNLKKTKQINAFGRMLKVKLPEIEANLRVVIAEWEGEDGNDPLVVDGEPYLAAMEREIAEEGGTVLPAPSSSSSSRGSGDRSSRSSSSREASSAREPRAAAPAERSTPARRTRPSTRTPGSTAGKSRIPRPSPAPRSARTPSENSRVNDNHCSIGR